MKQITLTHPAVFEIEEAEDTFVISHYCCQKPEVKLTNMKNKEYRSRGKFGRYIKSYAFLKQ